MARVPWFQFAPQENRLSATEATGLLTTPLNALHLELGARMVPFAGYSMPVQYPTGLMAEHLHTRSAAGLFDVSHMGQLRLVGDDAAAAFETLMQAVALVQAEQIDFLLAVGGGSVIDGSKFVAAAAHFEGDPWQILASFGSAVTSARLPPRRKPSPVPRRIRESERNT